MNNQSIKFAFKQGITTFICTFVICAIVFFFLNPADKAIQEGTMEILMTMVITCLITGFVMLAMVRVSVKKGGTPPMGDMESQVKYAYMPKNKVLFIVIHAVICFFIFGCAPIGLFAAIAPGLVVPRFAYIAMMAFLAALSAFYMAFNAHIFFGSLYQKTMKAEADPA